MSSTHNTHNHCFSHHHYQAWCHQIFFVNNTKIFVTSSVLKLQKWFLHQNGVESNQKSKYDLTKLWPVVGSPKHAEKMLIQLISATEPSSPTVHGSGHQPSLLDTETLQLRAGEVCVLNYIPYTAAGAYNCYWRKGSKR